jgi:hypothetical protein
VIVCETSIRIESETHESRLTSHNAMGLFATTTLLLMAQITFPPGILLTMHVYWAENRMSAVRFSDLKNRQVFSGPNAAHAIGACIRAATGPGPILCRGGVLGVLPGIVGAIKRMKLSS